MIGIPTSLAPLLQVLGSEATNQIVAVESTRDRTAVAAPLPVGLHPALGDGLRAAGIGALYSHQSEAWDAVAEGHDVVIVTATASGKTLCFNLPIVNAALSDPGVRALYLYPTKALANDQAAGLADLVTGLPVTLGVYHGDTAEEERARLRSSPPSILITNPDTLHYNQLSRHSNWAHWWRGLRYVVIDEAHAYRGVFGSHVAHVLRRLRRLAAYYGADPQFISASATIGNPEEHVEALTGRTPVAITNDGSPQVARDFVLWRPDRSSELETARLIEAAVRAGRSVIGFARSRKAVERIRRTIRRDLARLGKQDLDHAIAVYRAGYLSDRRREIEAGLRSGELRGVISTNALELGIDIGSLAVAVLSSYPGSTMAFRQQAGRAGRRDTPALVLMVIGENPLDEYIAEHPEWAISAGAERAATDISNESVSAGQLGCAARELPLSPSDRGLYQEAVWRHVDELVRSGGLIKSGARYSAGPSAARPRDVNLRSIEGSPYRLVYQGRVIGDIDARYIAMEAHPGAIYLQDGEPYRVERLDRPGRTVILGKAPENVLTRPVGERYVNVRQVLAEAQSARSGLLVRLCELHVRSRVPAYVEIDEQTRKPISDEIRIDPISVDLHTMGIELDAHGGDGPALHGVEHLVRALAPLVVLCDPADLDGHTDLQSRTTGAAHVFDRSPGGSGLSRKLFEGFDPIVVDAGRRLSSCNCSSGCPLCLHLGNCLFRNDDLSKPGAAALLRVALAELKERPARPRATSTVRGSRACSQCGRVFAEFSWAKGYPYLPHNRTKGSASGGVCTGSARPAESQSVPDAMRGGPNTTQLRAINALVERGIARPIAVGLVMGLSVDSNKSIQSHDWATVPRARPTESSRTGDAASANRLRALEAWRTRTAARIRRSKPEEVASNAKLRRIAEANPTSLRELQLVGDFPDLWIAAFGNDVLTTLREA